MAALPDISALEQCADFSQTVEPYLPQLYALPETLWHTIQSQGSLLELYKQTNPLVLGFAFSIFLGVIFLVVSEINQNFSQVDRCWSLLPTFYIGHFTLWARLNEVPSQRVEAALFFSILWSIRLTFNYWRRGGYQKGSEDYRWEIVRNAVPAVLFHLLNLTFIAFIQSILLFLLTAPVYTIMLASQIESTPTAVDYAFVSIEVGLVTIEWFADQQQWDFQTAKYHFKDTGMVTAGYTEAEFDRGFNTHGLWGFSRHPNFAAEQTIWLVLYQWSCFASNALYGWVGVGAGFLLMLFQGSTWLTEVITSNKYPEYRVYQKHVGMFVPTSVSPYRTPQVQPRVIRTSELAEKQKQKANGNKN